MPVDWVASALLRLCDVASCNDVVHVSAGDASARWVDIESQIDSSINNKIKNQNNMNDFNIDDDAYLIDRLGATNDDDSLATARACVRALRQHYDVFAGANVVFDNARLRALLGAAYVAPPRFAPGYVSTCMMTSSMSVVEQFKID